VPLQDTGRLSGSQSDTSSLFRRYTQSLLLSLVVIDTVLSSTCLSSFQGKVKFTLEQAMKARRRSRSIALLLLCTRRALDGVCGQHHVPAALLP
jgi:hypothetical protein